MKIIQIIILSCFAFAVIGQNNKEDYSIYGQQNQVSVHAVNPEQLAVTVALDHFDFKEIVVKDKNFFRLHVDGYSMSIAVGKPELPVVTKLIQIPEEAVLHIEDVSYNTEVIDASRYVGERKLTPVQHRIAKSDDAEKYPFVQDELVYSNDEYYKNPIVDVGITGRLRAQRIAHVHISPFQYNPVENTVKVLKNIQFTIRFEHANWQKTNALHKKYQSSYFRGIERSLAHTAVLKSGDVITSYPVKYVIVADRMFEETLQPFMEWKRRKGFIVIEAYTDEIGSTTGEIRTYLKSMYDNATPDDPAPTFALLVGDVDQIPAFDGEAGYHVTDLYYFEYTGDYLPDVFYGRFSANSVEELQPQIDKTLAYEQYQLDDPTYLENALLISGVDASYAPTYGNGQINYGHTYYFNEENNINPLVYLYPESGSAREAMLAHVDEGVAFANYTAHCDAGGWAEPAFSSSDVDNIIPSGKYGMFIGNCCQSGMFALDACFAEKIVRAEDKGAIGYIGASNLSFWDEDYYFGVGVGPISANPTYDDTGLGMYDRLFHSNGEDRADWLTTNGQMLMAGNLAVTASTSDRKLYYWEMYHLFGDPSLSTYLGVPGELTVNHLESVPIGVQYFEIETVPYAFISLTKDETLIASMEADAEGTAAMDISDISLPGLYTLHVNKQNYQPYFADITVVQSNEPFVILQDFTLEDLEGNTKESANPGEQISIHVDLKNVGGVDGENIEMLLRTNDVYVQIEDSTKNVSTIGSEEIVSLNHAFSVRVKENVPDQHRAYFEIFLSDDTHQWHADFYILLNAPVIHITELLINDSAGNNNNTMEPGEAVYLNFQVANNGHFKFNTSNLRVGSEDERLTVFENDFQLEPIDMNQQILLEVPLIASPECLVGELVPIQFTVDAGAVQIDTTIQLKMGKLIEDFEFGDFTKYNWMNTSVFKWEVNDLVVFEETIISGEDTTILVDSILPLSGDFFAHTPQLPASTRSELEITLDVMIDDSISFYKKVSCENGQGNKYDYLEFLIDGISYEYWDGEDDWSYHAYPVSKGEHTFTWRYYKDGYVSEGYDMAWIDRVSFPAFDKQLTSSNHIPQFELAPELITHQDQEYTCTLTVTDEDAGDTPEVQLFMAPEFLSLTGNGENFVLSGTPASSDLGTHTIVLSAYDGETFNTYQFVLEVTWPVGIGNQSLEKPFSIYPNPFQENLHIEGPVSSIVVYDYTGKEIPFKKGNNEIKLSAPAGIYILKISDGENDWYYKLVKSDNF